MRDVYVCADCGEAFSIEFAHEELETCLDENHTDRCPGCGQQVGRAIVNCQHCRQPFVVDVPHQHVRCQLTRDRCPRCGEQYSVTCIC
jgi:DNA-directed RNA polymerase subunit RPC12/RpoP